MADLSTGGLGLLGKFMQGYTQGKMLKEGKQERVNTQKIQQKLLDLKLKEQEDKNAWQELFRQYLGTTLQETDVSADGPSTTPDSPWGDAQFSDRFEGTQEAAPGLLDKLSQDPIAAALGKEVTGIDFLGAARAETQKDQLELSKKREARQASEQVPYQEYVPGTGYVTKFRRKYGEQEPFLSKPPDINLRTRTDPNTGQKMEVPVDRYGNPVGKPQVVEPLKGESTDAAARIALANNGKRYGTELEKMFVNPDGSINRQLVLAGAAPFGGVGEGRTAYAKFLDALDARARAATGAAMPDSEVKNYTAMYWPNVLDPDETIKDKLKRLNSFLNDYIKTLDPSGIVQKRLQKEDPLGIR